MMKEYACPDFLTNLHGLAEFQVKYYIADIFGGTSNREKTSMDSNVSIDKYFIMEKNFLREKN
jgi:hypothetical protein